MAVESTMLALGTPAPPFRLPDPSGREYDLDGVATGASGLLVMFLCNHCPYVKHLQRELALLCQRWSNRGLAVVGIASNDVDAYPDDRPELLAVQARTVGFTFPYLVDGDQSVALAYTAACTPDFFLFDGDRRLVYRGRFDDARPRNDRPVTGADLNAAVTAVLSGGVVDADQWPSMGCGIKWRPGRTPSWG
jgi:peroxiredoxin